MGYHATWHSSFILVDPETGKVTNDKIYTSRGHAERYKRTRSYAGSYTVFEITPEMVKAALVSKNMEVGD